MSRGKTSALQRAEPGAAAPPDYAAVFEQAAPPCLLVRPDAPRFSAVAASAAFVVAMPDLVPLPGSAVRDVLACGLGLDEDAQATLSAALERAAGSGAPARLTLPGAGDVVVTPVLRAGAVHLLALRLTGERAAAPAGADTSALEHGRELARARAELEDARAELAAFGYSVSHDLRSPLRAIDGFAQALAEECGDRLGEDARRHLTRVQAGARRMSSLLDDLLALSRIQLTPLRRAHVDLGALARQCAARLAAEHPERTVTVEVEGSLEAWADPLLAATLLGLLLDNAFKFTSNRPSAHIQVGRDRAAPAPTFFVADDGVGFELGHAKRLFSPFQRMHRASDYPGNGIGLAIARRIVLRHGGRIWAEAEPARGARFWFSLEERQAGG